MMAATELYIRRFLEKLNFAQRLCFIDETLISRNFSASTNNVFSGHDSHYGDHSQDQCDHSANGARVLTVIQVLSGMLSQVSSLCTGVLVKKIAERSLSSTRHLKERLMLLFKNMGSGFPVTELIYQLLKLENGWRNKDVVCSVQAGGSEVFTMQVIV